MITQVKEGYDYIHIAVGIVDGDGKAADPSAAEALFYKVSQADGSISLDTNISGDGKVTLAKQAGETGFYGAAVEISALSANEYVVLYKVTIDEIESITVEFFSIDLSKKQINSLKIMIELIEEVEIGEWLIAEDVLFFLDPTGQVTIAAFQLHYDNKGNVIRRERIS